MLTPSPSTLPRRASTFPSPLLHRALPLPHLALPDCTWTSPSPLVSRRRRGGGGGGGARVSSITATPPFLFPP
ncbi:uncharacterized protein DS421_4g120470 [Arachis hypogaea]|nr:uncharacterized protein DS421_4g120470 [Arachis hypogaea]